MFSWEESDFDRDMPNPNAPDIVDENEEKLKEENEAVPIIANFR